MTETAELPRSYLYVPGLDHDKFIKAWTRGADAIVIDLDDSAPPDRKLEARSSVRTLLETVDPTLSTEVWVRMNSGAEAWEDVGATHSLPALTGLVIAKAELAADVLSCAQALSDRGDDETILMPLLETAGAILNARRISEQPRVRQLQIGEVRCVRIDAGARELRAPEPELGSSAVVAAGELVVGPAEVLEIATHTWQRVEGGTELLTREQSIVRHEESKEQSCPVN